MFITIHHNPSRPHQYFITTVINAAITIDHKPTTSHPQAITIRDYLRLDTGAVRTPGGIYFAFYS